MRVSLSWLREYVTVDVPLPELAARLAITSCEVDRILRRGVPDEDSNLGFYRVGRVLEAGRHPNADRLQLCSVDVGEREPRRIVCGAWNFGTGSTVAVALPGAVLPGGRRLERRELRGTVSDGMILSERELELGHDHTGILVLAESWEPGTPLADVLPLADDVLEIETGFNRPDLLAVYGIAREVAVLYDLELGPPPGRDPERRGEELVNVQVEDLAGAPRYVGRLLRDVEVAPSPPWLKARLIAAGMRPISNVVDVTNYVMLALGNPLHAFDEAKLAERRIVVRRAAQGEAITTLDGIPRELGPRDLVIADAARPVGIAGIMGSLESEVGEETTDVLLEAANFEPVGIRQSSERLALRTEGSSRWEKGVDPYLAEQAARLATELIVDLAGARWTGEVDVRGELPARPAVRLRPQRTDALVGLVTPPDEQRRILERLGFDVGDDWTVTVPTWRARDVTREVDLVEEVARFRLGEVPFTLPARREMFGRLTEEQRLRRRVEDVLAGLGFSEAYTPSLVSVQAAPDGLRLPVPLSAEQAALRTTLLDGLIGSARHNLDVGNEEIALFEIARVYLTSGERLPNERWRLGGITEGGFGRAKGAVAALHSALKIRAGFERTEEPFLHPGKAARVEAGWVGELHPTLLEGAWGAFELDLRTLFTEVPERVLYRSVVPFPSVRHLLTFLVDESVPAGELLDVASGAAGDLLGESAIVSDFRGGQLPKGMKTVTLGLSFQSPERTLSDQEAAALREQVAAALAERFGAELRG